LVGAFLVAAGDLDQLKGCSGFKPKHILGGVGGAAIVLVSLVTGAIPRHHRCGRGTDCSPLIVSALLDRLAVLGLDKTQLTAPRVLGIALLVVGTILVPSR
jgi:uncharacterized membrane protein YdcZ (DUF606 family)